MQPGDARRPCDAAQPEQRHPSYVGAHPEAAGDPGVQRRHGDAGDGGRHDQVDVRRCQPGLLERTDDGCAAELHRVLDEHVVGGAEVGEAGVIIEREHHVSAVDLRAAVYGMDEVGVLCVPGDRQQSFGHLLLRIAIPAALHEHLQ